MKTFASRLTEKEIHMKTTVLSAMAVAILFCAGCATAPAGYVRKPVDVAALSAAREMTDAEALDIVRPVMGRGWQETARQMAREYGNTAHFTINELNRESFTYTTAVEKFHGMKLTVSMPPVTVRFADMTGLDVKQAGDGRTVEVFLTKEGEDVWALPVMGTDEGDRLISALAHLCPNLKQ